MAYINNPQSFRNSRSILMGIKTNID